MESPKPKIKLSDMPSYLRPLYSFPEHRECYLNVSQLQIEKPWKSMAKSFNQKTSYATSYSPPPTSGVAIITAKQIVKAPNIFSSNTLEKPGKPNNKSKSLAKVVDAVAQESAIYGRKISPAKINSPIGFQAEHFSSAVENYNNMRTSSLNNQWIAQNERRKYAEKFNTGGYIPAVTQMQIYGRREPKSKFEANELWKQSFF